MNRRAKRQHLRHVITACSLIMSMQVHSFSAFFERIFAIDYRKQVVGKLSFKRSQVHAWENPSLIFLFL